MDNRPPTSWEILETLPGTQFYRLYKSPASALAIFRKRLTNLAKYFVMTLLYMPRPMLVSNLELLIKPSSISEYRHAIDLLHQYHIVKDTTSHSARAYSLTKEFARSLRSALVGTGDKRSFGDVYQVSRRDVVEVSELDEYAREQWEGILGYMVGSTAADSESGPSRPPPPASVIEILRAGRLIHVAGTYTRTGAAQITKEGFAFVLQDVSTQIWTLLFLFVENAEAFGWDKVDVLSFLFLISSLELGVAYSRKALTESQRKVLQNLTSFGIVYQPIDDEGEPTNHFWPTRLATTLTTDSSAALSMTNAALGSSLSPSSGSDASQGFIIVETNYRVYAYTSSPLQIALLSLFVTLRSRHPNLVTGKMTKVSVRRAVQAGITAEQIISYLTSHAHPQMRRYAQAEQAKAANQGKMISVLPATILDQIYLWQLESDRMTTTTGFLLKDFDHAAEYENICRYADELGVLVWKNDKRRMFFVSRIEAVKDYIAARREGRAAGQANGTAVAGSSR